VEEHGYEHEFSNLASAVIIGTGWMEAGKAYNQIRVVDAEGNLVGAYAKTCLTYNDATEFSG
jgi:predicted amidohydrolase